MAVGPSLAGDAVWIPWDAGARQSVYLAGGSLGDVLGVHTCGGFAEGGVQSERRPSSLCQPCFRWVDKLQT